MMGEIEAQVDKAEYRLISPKHIQLQFAHKHAFDIVFGPDFQAFGIMDSSYYRKEECAPVPGFGETDGYVSLVRVIKETFRKRCTTPYGAILPIHKFQDLAPLIKKNIILMKAFYSILDKVKSYQPSHIDRTLIEKPSMRIAYTVSFAAVSICILITGEICFKLRHKEVKEDASKYLALESLLDQKVCIAFFVAV